ncbi:MAG: hypothetical protein EOM24_08470 [Chloroflexia bacterium]|nr:hypothetical protein [Chloroflexia bacterium]
MPYRMLEELHNRRKEKVAVLLTFEHLVGIILVVLPCVVVSAGLPLLVRAPLIIGAALLGLALTLDVGGMAIYEHLLWQLRGQLRMRMHGRIITPEMLTGTVPNERGERPLAVDGPVQIVRDPRQRRRPPVPKVGASDARVSAPPRDEVRVVEPQAAAD